MVDVGPYRIDLGSNAGETTIEIPQSSDAARVGSTRKLGTAPRRAALPSTRLEARSRLALPSPPLYRTTRSRHGARGLPRLFPGRRCALPACQLLFVGGRPQPTPHATPTRVRISPGRHRIRADKSRRPNRYRTLPPHLIVMSVAPAPSNNQMNRDWTPPGPGWVYREKKETFSDCVWHVYPDCFMSCGVLFNTMQMAAYAANGTLLMSTLM